MSDGAEEWRPVVGYEDLYEVSDLGRVRSVDRDVPQGANRTQHWPGKLLKLSPSPSCGPRQGRYLEVYLSRGGKKRTVRVHHLVLEAFIAPPATGL